MAVVRVVCPSRITSVVVYARGAIVTRLVEPPELGGEGAELVVSRVSPLARSGGLRVTAVGREVVGVKSSLVYPSSVAAQGQLRARVQSLLRQRDVLYERKNVASAARAEVELVAPAPRIRARLRHDPLARMGDALAVTRLAEAIAARLDQERLQLDEQLATLGRELSAAELSLAQAKSLESAAGTTPTREITVQLAPGVGRLSQLEISYAVPAARWWPAYAARLSTTTGRAQFFLEAFVAQLSQEDWSGVKLQLSTADMVQDVRLPELSSLRIGRAQPPKSRGYRPPPAGLEALFAGFDATAGKAPPAGSIAPPPPPAPPHDLLPQGQRGGDGAITGSFRLDELSAASEPAPEMMEEAEMMMAPPGPPMAARAKSSGISFGFGGFGGGGAPPPPPGSRAAAPMAMPSPGSPAMNRPMAKPAPPPPELPMEPADAWLDFDALWMPGGHDPQRRGKLARRSDDEASAVSHAAHAIELVPAPPQVLDPRDTRGQFDHRYDAEGLAEVGSSGRPERIMLASGEAPCSYRFTAVPREGTDVFRQAQLTNPFPSPLLAGPVEVFVDGALTTTSSIQRVDRGGALLFGLGVEERLRVARNARVEESTKGLIGGTTAMDHHVTVDVSSALGREVELEVLERLPVTDEKELEIVSVSSTPPSEKYDQVERGGAPLRGGLRFRVKVPGGGKAALEYRYRLELPSKSEVEGGNRRE